jgi:hypothetical protein
VRVVYPALKLNLELAPYFTSDQTLGPRSIRLLVPNLNRSRQPQRRGRSRGFEWIVRQLLQTTDAKPRFH